MPFLKKLSLVSGLWLLATILSACTAVGTVKPAALQIATTPEASVFLNGKHVGKTPFYSDQLEAKEYTIKITTGEATYVEKITLNPSTLTVVNRELNNNFFAQSGEVLSLIQGQKGLSVISTPDNAQIIVDGQSKGQSPQIVDLPEGEHKVKLQKQGYIDREFEIKTDNKYQLVATVTLASEIAKGAPTAPSQAPASTQVVVQSTPQGFLRVRKDPSTSSTEIGRVKPGDKLELVQETQDWVQVKVDTLQGWVSSQYVKKAQ
ncbi:MAG TPA: PEGA domain-containing protein [Candidatus Saccharimonadales bacterium]|nr:PEGA domain-containing protein [Candidatus Saccharimonadales bacterium]